MRWFAFEIADFARMAMTVHGTVVYSRLGSTHWRWGSLLITEFEGNGQAGMRMRCSPLHIKMTWSLVLVMGKPVEVVKEFKEVEDIEEPVLSEELDMEMPLPLSFCTASVEAVDCEDCSWLSRA
jgi:hypothetical protein